MSTNYDVAIEWAIENEIDIINMSFAGDYPSYLVEQALDLAYKKGDYFDFNNTIKCFNEAISIDEFYYEAWKRTYFAEAGGKGQGQTSLFAAAFLDKVTLYRSDRSDSLLKRTQPMIVHFAIKTLPFIDKVYRNILTCRRLFVLLYKQRLTSLQK